MVIVEISPGVCGFATQIAAQSDDMLQVALEITSACPHIQALATELKQVSPLAEMRRSIVEVSPYQAAARHKLHAACPVPCAIMKAVEVAAGLALPADVHIAIRRQAAHD